MNKAMTSDNSYGAYPSPPCWGGAGGEAAVTLSSLLQSRDVRWQTERRLIHDNPGKAVVVLTVVMPGSVKRDWRSLTVAKAAVEAISEKLKGRSLWSETKDLETGFEGYWIVDGDRLKIKKEMCAIEETHPLGRLFDIDVLGDDAAPISRTAVGYPPRRCLLCDREARFCMRNHTHTQEEIQKKITQMVKSYSLL